MSVRVIGAGFAGVEAAYTLTRLGHRVELFEMKPDKKSPAHKSDYFAEPVCSNSFKALGYESSSGLLKEEMRRFGSLTLEAAGSSRVPAGGALAVDREIFSKEVTDRINADNMITVTNREVTDIDAGVPTIVATGPLTDGELAKRLSDTASGMLSFYDAAAPVIAASSIDLDRVFFADRYGYDREGDYLNCFFDREGYEDFIRELILAETAVFSDFEKEERVYESCMPIEKLAKRGMDAPRFGPMKPVGLVDPGTGRRPWASVQLRKEDAGGRLYNIVGFQTNLKFAEQRRIFRMIPGLEKAEFARYGVMHRNSFINSPEALNITLNFKKNPNVYVAGMLTGMEGYMEAAVSGILAARFLHSELTGTMPGIPPETTMCGALLRYITTQNRDFQPMGANFGLLPAIDIAVKSKKERRRALAERALEDIDHFLGGS